jgi:hypothetical protein
MYRLSIPLYIRCLGLIILWLIPMACVSTTDPEGQEATNSNRILAEGEFLTLEKGSSSQYGAPALFVFRSMNAWSSHYGLHRGEALDSILAPNVDFWASDVIAIHVGDLNAYSSSVSINSITYDITDGTTQVRYSVTSSGEGFGSILSPYIFVRTAASSHEYRFIQQ